MLDALFEYEFCIYTVNVAEQTFVTEVLESYWIARLVESKTVIVVVLHAFHLSHLASTNLLIKEAKVLVIQNSQLSLSQ